MNELIHMVYLGVERVLSAFGVSIAFDGWRYIVLGFGSQNHFMINSILIQWSIWCCTFHKSIIQNEFTFCIGIILDLLREFLIETSSNLRTSQIVSVWINMYKVTQHKTRGRKKKRKREINNEKDNALLISWISFFILHITISKICHSMSD